MNISIDNLNPIIQFSIWFEEAKKKILEPEAMALATASLDGVPSCRMVLLKSWDENGFVFFTNSKSRKGQEIRDNPRAAAIFYWKELNRQIVIDGEVSKVSKPISDQYFASRPRDSQLGAWASQQGEVLDSRETLLKKLEEMKIKYHGQSIPRPSYWNGYCLTPSRIEFWQEGEGRLHDRFSYRRQKDTWVIERLSP